MVAAFVQIVQNLINSTIIFKGNYRIRTIYLPFSDNYWQFYRENHKRIFLNFVIAYNLFFNYFEFVDKKKQKVYNVIVRKNQQKLTAP